MSSAVDLVQGLGVLTGIEVVDVPGATAGFDNDYARASATRASARSTIATCSCLHVEATDEAGHQGRADIKVDALERWDREVIGPIVDALDAPGEPYRILLLPDHATPCDDQDAQRRTGPVPAVRLDARRSGRASTPSRRPPTARRSRPRADGAAGRGAEPFRNVGSRSADSSVRTGSCTRSARGYRV